MNKTNKLSLLKNKHNNFMNCFIVNVFKISFLIIFVLIQVSCGSFQPVSYYSDGIYSSDNVIVIRKSDLDNDSNSYSRYFDQVARQYDWDDRRNDLVLSDIDSINSNSIDNYKTNPQWGGGQKTTQIFMFNNGPWGFQNFNTPFYAGFYSPFWNGWGWGNPMRWNRLGFWGWNRWAWNYGWNGNFGFYDPWLFGNPYWGFSPYNQFYSPYVGNYGVRGSLQSNRIRGWAYSSTYRGKNTGPANSNFRARSGQAQSNIARSTANSSVPDLVSEGRRLAQNNNSEQRRVNSNSDAQRRRIESIIRQYQSRGYNVELIPTGSNSDIYKLRVSENYGYQGRSFQNNSNSIFNRSSSQNNSSGKTNQNYNSSSNYSRNYSNSSNSRSYSSQNRGSYNASRGSSYGSSSVNRSSGRSSAGRSSGRKQ